MKGFEITCEIQFSSWELIYLNLKFKCHIGPIYQILDIRTSDS